MIPVERRHSPLARQVGTLALAHVQAPLQGAAAAVRAAAWSNRLTRLGLHVPLFIVHDLGLLLTAPERSGGGAGGNSVHIAAVEALLAKLALPAELRPTLTQYELLLKAVASSEVAQKASSWRLRDDLVAVLLARILGDVYQRWTDPTKKVGAAELPLDSQIYGDADLAGHFADFDHTSTFGFLRFVVSQQLHVLTALDQIDLDTVRLLGVLQPGGSSSALDLIDLYGVFRSQEVADVVDFSLELLPSVLETKRASGVQTFAVDGYASIERRGNIDALILSEMAWDDDLFEQKVADDELYYYGHEKQRTEERRLEYVLIDSSPSMRGVRQVFARALALTLAKKLVLQGDEVWVRFFDGVLHDVQRVSSNDFAAPYILSFKSERGRNYTKVFRQLLGELQRLRRDERRQVVVYFITHGQCHLPVELVQQLSREASLYGIFILPSSDMSLEYLDFLHRYQIVDQTQLGRRQERRDRALEIVAEAGRRRSAAPAAKAKAAKPAKPTGRRSTP